jgi:type 1 glutamine amidotransferase
MRTLAWTREFERARVFCYQSGHDAGAFDHPSFRTVVANGIRWVARRV